MEDVRDGIFSEEGRFPEGDVLGALVQHPASTTSHVAEDAQSRDDRLD